MKEPKILWFVVAVIILIAVVFVVQSAEAESEDYYLNCGHYKWVDVVPGGGFWLTSDATSLLPKITQDEYPFNAEGELVLVIARSSFALFGVPLQNTWGCHYTGGYYPPQEMVDGLVDGMYKDPLCVFVDENGGVTVSNTENGTCVLPEPPLVTPTTEPTLDPTECPPTPTVQPTEATKPGKAWQTKTP